MIGCDRDTVFSEFSQKKLCTYRQPFEDMSQFIYQTADDILKNPGKPFFHAEFAPRYIEGDGLNLQDTTSGSKMHVSPTNNLLL